MVVEDKFLTVGGISIDISEAEANALHNMCSGLGWRVMDRILTALQRGDISRTLGYEGKDGVSMELFNQACGAFQFGLALLRLPEDAKEKLDEFIAEHEEEESK